MNPQTEESKAQNAQSGEALPLDTLRAIILPIVQEAIKVAVQEMKGLKEDLSPEEKVRIEEEVRNEWERQRKEPHFWVEFHMLPDDKDDQVYVGVNGVSYWYKKNMKVPIPQCVMDALAYAKVDTYAAEIDPVTGQYHNKRFTYMRYPYTFFGPASLDDVEAWKKENSKQLN